jgi:hypothetical protein
LRYGDTRSKTVKNTILTDTIAEMTMSKLLVDLESGKKGVIKTDKTTNTSTGTAI